MKVLIYSHFFAPSIGGVESIVESLARGIAELRNPQGDAEFRVTLATEIPGRNFDDSAMPFRIIRQPSYLRLWRLLRAADVMHLAGPALAPLIMGRLAGKPVVLEHHGFQAICPNGQLLMEPSNVPCPGHFMAGNHFACLRCNAHDGWWNSCKLWALTFLRRYLCARVAANIVPTNYLGDMLRLPRISTIVHGLLPAAAVPKSEGADSGPPIIVFQGRLVSTKGAELLLRAGELLKREGYSFQLVLIGEGPERQSLTRLTEELRLNADVKFTGRLSAEELEVRLAQARVVVVPSLAGEVFGLVVAENMGRGNAIVASDVGAFVEVLGNAGVIFRTGDYADLASKIAPLLRDPSLAEHMGKEARKRVHEQFHRDTMIAEHALRYRAVSGPKSKFAQSTR